MSKNIVQCSAIIRGTKNFNNNKPMDEFEFDLNTFVVSRIGYIENLPSFKTESNAVDEIENELAKFACYGQIKNLLGKYCDSVCNLWSDFAMEAYKAGMVEGISLSKTAIGRREK